MKIAILNIHQNKSNRGAETFVREVAKRLQGLHVVDVFGGSTLPPKRSKYFWRTNLDGHGLAIARFSFSKIKILLKNHYDVVIPLDGGWEVLIVKLVSIFSGSKVVVSGQSGIGWDDRINLYSFPSSFVGLTSYQSSWAKNVNPFVRIDTIPNGVDLLVFKNIRLNTIKNTILSVGAFTKEKRHDLTIRAVSRLKDINLVIVGDGGDVREEIHCLGQKLLGSRFKILSVDSGKMWKVYKEAGVLAFPSVSWESFGIAIVEAMASGLPVVATNDPIRTEIVGDAGILVDPENTEEYANALKKALETDWKNLPRKQAENFSWDNIAKKYETLFKSLLKKE